MRDLGWREGGSELAEEWLYTVQWAFFEHHTWEHESQLGLLSETLGLMLVPGSNLLLDTICI